MKKIILSFLTLAVSLSLFAQGQVSTRKHRLLDFPDKMTMVVLSENEVLSAALRQEVINVWTATTFEFCTLEQFEKLQKECADEGIYIELDSTTRSVAEQQKLWDDWTVEKGEDYVKKYVAVPGYSEHHTGLAIDVCLDKDGKRIDDNDDMIAEKEIFAKVHAKLAKYGFILRYLEGKDAETGYSYEPWHFRYINDPTIAKEIMDKGITLEAYLGELK